MPRPPNCSFDLARLRDGLKPFRLYWFPRLRSTSDHAGYLRKHGGLFAPAVVLTGHQIAGRGRGMHRWWSSKGCMTVTFAMPIDDQLAPHQLPLLAGVAVRNAAAEISASPDIELKWPNDLLHKGRKLAGLLCERVHQVDLIGLGLNVNLESSKAPRDIRRRVTSLMEIAGRPLDMTEALLAVARQLKAILRRGAGKPFAALLREYDDHHALVGQRVTLLDAALRKPIAARESSQRVISGICEGLDEMGCLMVRVKGVKYHVISGQVRIDSDVRGAVK